MKFGLRQVPPVPRRIEYAPPVVRNIALTETLREPEPVRHVSPPIEGLDDVALQLRTLPYADFIEYAQAIGAEPARVWQWAIDRKVRL